MNFRIALIVALALIVSTLFSVFVFVSTSAKLALLITIGAMLFVCLILLIVFKKKFFAVLFTILFFFILPAANIFIKSNELNSNLSINVENCKIYGKIYTKKEDLDKKNVKLYLTDITIISENSENKINGNIFVYVRTQNLDVSKLSVGKYVFVNSDVKFYSLQDDNLGKVVSKISDGVVGDCYVYAYQISIAEKTSLSIKDKIKSWVLDKSADYKYADIGYAMLFGDTSVLNPDTKGIFQESGTAHLLAVSGFHVSLVVLMLSFILNKLKAGRYIKFFSVGIVLFIYGYLCGFSVSAVRAIIMSLLALYATVRTKEYDGLSALSIAASILLLISPLQLFDISFILSFTSVLSIILIKPILTRLFSKFFYDKFASTIALNLSVQLGLFITQLYYFKSVSLLSVLTNLVTVPLASFAFMYYLVAIIISAVLPFLSQIVILFDWIMLLILRFNNLVAGIAITIESVSIVVFALTYLLMFVVSDYVFVKQKCKSVLSLIILVIMTGLMII